MNRTAKHLVSAAAVAAMLALAAPALASGAHEVTVYHGSQVVARFPSAKCNTPHHTFVALTPKTAAGYSLFVYITSFTGFHTYDLVQGNTGENPFVVLSGPGVRYTNLYAPPFPSPGFGQIRFAVEGKRKLMGVGYHPAFAEDGSLDAVTFTGVLECHYLKKRRR